MNSEPWNSRPAGPLIMVWSTYLNGVCLRESVHRSRDLRARRTLANRRGRAKGDGPWAVGGRWEGVPRSSWGRCRRSRRYLYATDANKLCTNEVSRGKRAAALACRLPAPPIRQPAKTSDVSSAGTHAAAVDVWRADGAMRQRVACGAHKCPRRIRRRLAPECQTWPPSPARLRRWCRRTLRRAGTPPRLQCRRRWDVDCQLGGRVSGSVGLLAKEDAAQAGEVSARPVGAGAAHTAEARHARLLGERKLQAQIARWVVEQRNAELHLGRDHSSAPGARIDLNSDQQASAGSRRVEETSAKHTPRQGAMAAQQGSRRTSAHGRRRRRRASGSGPVWSPLWASSVSVVVAHSGQHTEGWAYPHSHRTRSCGGADARTAGARF